MRINEKLLEMLQTTQRLTDLIAEENHLLETQRPAAIKPLLDEKERLSAAYARGLTQIKAFSQAELKGSDAALRQSLNEAMVRFQDNVVRNGKLLLQMKTLSEGLVSAVTAEANRGREPASVYSASGRLNARASAASLALNTLI